MTDSKEISKMIKEKVMVRSNSPMNIYGKVNGNMVNYHTMVRV